MGWVFHWYEAKKNQNGRLKKFKMAASKKPHFPAPPILNIFSWNSHGLVLGLVELFDAKGIGLAQPIWSWRDQEVINQKVFSQSWTSKLSTWPSPSLKLVHHWRRKLSEKKMRVVKDYQRGDQTFESNSNQQSWGYSSHSKRPGYKWLHWRLWYSLLTTSYASKKHR